MWLAFTGVVLLCCIDYMYFTEGWGAILMDDKTRKFAHLAILLAIIPVGYIGWYRHPVLWLKKVWVWSHIISISAIVLVGAICYAIGYFDKALLKKIGDLRLFFCSPVPYFMLYILSVISRSMPQVAQK